MRPNTKASRQTDLLYAVDDVGDMLFVPRALVYEVLQTRRVLPELGRWREAREQLPPRFYDRLVDDWVEPTNQPPPEDYVLPPDGAVQFGEWPRLLYSEMRTWLPEELWQLFGGHVEGAIGACWRLPAADDQVVDREQELLRWLSERGYRCEEDDRLPELFGE